MIIEAHVIQNVAPANLNRDDTGAAKDAVFGGCRRARVSSQAWKRAVRQWFEKEYVFGQDELAWRTKRLTDEVVKKLVASGRDPELAKKAVIAAMSISGAKFEEKENHITGRTKVLWFVARNSINDIAELCEKYWDTLSTASFEKEEQTKQTKAKNNKGSSTKLTIKTELSNDDKSTIKKTIETNVIGAKAVDIALFGRMLTDAPTDGTVEAAVQVAHAISTNRIETEFDYFVAVDDLLPSDETGAGMIETIEFNSACLYRYACLDTNQLLVNLGGDATLAQRATEAFLLGFVTAMPSGKQNTFAANNPPQAVVLVSRETGAWNLANAFVDPVYAKRETDLVAASCERLACHWKDLTAMYGNPATALYLACLPSLKDRFADMGSVQNVSLDEAVSALGSSAFLGQS